MTSRPLILKLTTLEPEKAAQALNVASVSLASGAKVSLWLTGDAIRLAQPGFAETIQLEHSAPFNELLEAILPAGSITACTQCLARRSLSQSDLIAGVGVAGAGSFAAEILAPDAQALIY